MGLDKSRLFLAALMAGAHMLASMPFGTTSGYLRSGNFVDFPCKRHLAKLFSVFPCSLCKQGVTGSIPVTSTNLIPALVTLYAASSTALFWCDFGTFATLGVSGRPKPYPGSHLPRKQLARVPANLSSLVVRLAEVRLSRTWIPFLSPVSG